MIHRRRTLLLLPIFAFAAHSTATQSAKKPAAPAPPAAEKLPTPEQVLDSYIKALGGAAVLSKLSSRVMKGIFEVPDQNIIGVAEIYRAAPDKLFTRVHLEPYGDFLQGFDGQVGWSSDPNAGLREFSGEELAQTRRDSQFQHELRFNEIYPERKVLGKEKVRDRDAWVLQAVAEGAPPEKFYFDADSGLLARHDVVQITPDGRIDVEQDYSDYAVFDGVRLPTFIRHVDAQTTWQVRLNSITHNVPIEASKFAKPSAQ